MSDTYSNQIITEKKSKSGKPMLDLSGKTFHRLTPIRPQRNVSGRYWWLCACSCGNEIAVASAHLTSGNTKSCGCLKRERTSAVRKTHGGSETLLYSKWLNMKRRCFDPRNNHFKSYGLRGITVCKGWLNFKNFQSDIGQPPTGRSIDRINNDGNYSCGHCDECIEKQWPANCRWATPTQQARNKSTTTTVTHNGETKTLLEWSDIVGVGIKILRDRLGKLGWTAHRALSTPVLEMKNRRHWQDSP